MKEKIKHLNSNQDKRVIDETEELRLEYQFEETFLINKLNNQILLEDNFFGDPQCGLIDKENKWVIIGGIHLTLWTPNETRKYQTREFKNIHSVRVQNEEIVEILTDPWNEDAGIWELNIKSQTLSKVSNFKKYLDEEYTEQVEW